MSLGYDCKPLFGVTYVCLLQGSYIYLALPDFFLKKESIVWVDQWKSIWRKYPYVVKIRYNF